MNIYGKPLAQCRTSPHDARGSWDRQGFCSDRPHDRGRHQMCVSLPAHFSERTGQSDWSRHRAGRPHCVCLGAYALYNRRRAHDKTLPEARVQCSAIPASIFDYSEDWNRWNGLERQYRDPIALSGYRALLRACDRPGFATDEERAYFRSRMEKLMRN